MGFAVHANRDDLVSGRSLTVTAFFTFASQSVARKEDTAKSQQTEGRRLGHYGVVNPVLAMALYRRLHFLISYGFSSTMAMSFA